jgi:hypothetical protein
MRAFLKKIYNITLLRHVNCVGIGELPELVLERCLYLRGSLL